MTKELNELKELIMVVGQHYRDVGDLFGGNGKNSSSKLANLYQGIASGEYFSDEAATAQLYANELVGSSYRKLKFSLREKLINALFDLDVRSAEYNDYQKAYYECHKLWAAVKILLGKNANAAATTLALKLFKQAEHFEFTAMAMDIASALRLHYGIREGDTSKFTFYSERYDYHVNLYLLEGKAEQLYLDSVIIEVTSKEQKPSGWPTLEAAFKQISALLLEGNSYRLNLYAALVQLSYFSAKKDYAAAKKICKEHIDYFTQKNYEAHIPLQIFFYQQLIFSFNLKQFSERSKLAQVCKSYMQEGSYNWFKYQEVLLQMALYEEDYAPAFDIHFQATKHPRFSLLPENVTEVWTVIRAHLYFLAISQAVDFNPKRFSIKSFRAKKFDNETVLYSKDKRGLNITIQIIQFVILLVENKRAEAIDHIEALEQYSYRHLRKEEYLRSRIFIKMLLSIPLSGFDTLEFKKKNELNLQKLNSAQSFNNAQLSEIEILPYESIWKILCNTFQSRPSVDRFNLAAYSHA
jgi:head-tail adaptor